jgi:hypothetical protein
MSVQSDAPRSRRMFMTGALGAVAATVASAIGRPAPVLAGSDGDVVLGQLNNATTTTSIHTTDYVALSAQAVGGSGLEASSTSGPGIIGASQTGAGVVGYSAGGQAVAVTGSGRLFQHCRSTSGRPPAGTYYSKGEQIRDAAGDLWLCTGDGNPGTWSKVRSLPTTQGWFPGTVLRASGANRFESAAAISAMTFAPGVLLAYIAYAYNFPDALAAAAAAGMVPGPVLLVDRNVPLPAATVTELSRLKPHAIVVVGGTASVSEGVRVALSAYAVGG